MTNTKKPRKAVFPFAIFGTLFLPATKVMPKELLPIVDKPLTQYAAEEAIAAGIDTLIFLTRCGISRRDHAGKFNWQMRAISMRSRGLSKLCM
jgi:UTP--glucose-1-phosphate uridylyltransferase